MSVLASYFFDDVWFHVQRQRFIPEETQAQVDGLTALLGLEAGLEVLDVPVGTGRIAVPLALAGMHVTGVDLHEAVLSDAAVAAAAAGVKLELHRRDMRDLPWEERFDVALNLWGSFGYFDDPGNAALAAALCRALVPGGRLVIEGPGAEALFSHWQPRRWNRWGDTTVLEEASFDALSGVVESTWTFIRDGRETNRSWRMRVYSGAELAGLLKAAGFSKVELFGGLDGAAYGIGATRLVCVATR